MDYRCTICFEIKGPETQAQPNKCPTNHNFCLDCIRKWSKRHNSCPLDFKKFDAIIVCHTGERIKVAKRRKKSKPALYDFTAICEICQVEDDSELVLCDSCDLAYHKECLTPPLEIAPEGSWECPTCQEVVQRKRKNNFLTKDEAARRRRGYSRKEIGVAQNSSWNLEEAGNYSGKVSWQQITSKIDEKPIKQERMEERNTIVERKEQIEKNKMIEINTIVESKEQTEKNKMIERNTIVERKAQTEKNNRIEIKTHTVKNSMLERKIQTDKKNVEKVSRLPIAYGYHNPFCKCCHNLRFSALNHVKIAKDGSMSFNIPTHLR